MNAWKEVQLSSVVDINARSYSPKDNFRGVYYLDTGNITQNTVDEIVYYDLESEKLPSRARRKIKLNSVVYSTVRPNQRHYGIIRKEMPSNFLVSTGFAVIDAKQEYLTPEYLYYYLTQNEIVETLQSIAEQSVSTYPSITAKDIGNLQLQLPPVETQNRIASILRSLDDKIELNNRINENLEQQAQAIYQAWFQDFILSGGFCPPSWKQGTLADIAIVTSGKRPPLKAVEKTDSASIPLVGAASVMGYTSQANHTDKILVTGRVGTHGVIQRFNSPCWASDNTLVITSNYYEYTYQILQRIDYHSMNRGSTQPLITQGDMNKVSVLIPDVDTLNRFEMLVGKLMELHQKNCFENVKIAETRDALLPKLMSGELDVSEVFI